MHFENPKVSGDTSIFDGLVYSISHFDNELEECRIYMKVSFSLITLGKLFKRKWIFYGQTDRKGKGRPWVLTVSKLWLTATFTAHVQTSKMSGFKTQYFYVFYSVFHFNNWVWNVGRSFFFQEELWGRHSFKIEKKMHQVLGGGLTVVTASWLHQGSPVLSINNLRGPFRFFSCNMRCSLLEIFGPNSRLKKLTVSICIKQ